MIKAIIELSKYILAIDVVLYALISFVIVWKEDEKRNSFLLVLQDLLIFISHLTCSLVLLYHRKELIYLFLPSFQMLTIFAFIVLTRAIYPKSNRLILNHTALLLSVGFVMLTRLNLNKSLRQFAFAAIGMFAALIIPVLFKKMNVIYRLKWLYSLIGILLLMTVLITGNITHGSKLAFSIFGFSFQPSEFIKILIVLFIAIYISEGKSFLNFCISALIAGAHVIILVLSKDLGSALIYFITYFLLIYVITGKKRYLSLGFLGAIAASVASYFLFPHVRVRVSSWINPWLDIDNKGYQITQSMFAIGTGGWFGMGIDSGTPATIPYVEKDFIFSAICEEYGVIFGICLIAICVNLFIEFIHVGKRCEEDFYKYTAYGLGFIYISQLFLTIGGNVKFIPLTGVTFPMISYGGSSLLSSLMIIGIIQGLNINNDLYMTEEYPESRNRQINTITLFCSFCFICIALYISYFVKVDSTEVINNSYNAKRQDILAQQTIRGDIYANDGTVLATTVLRDGKEERYYPYDDMYAHTVGFSSKGKMGIEQIANIYLVSSNVSLNNKLSDDIEGQKHKGNNVYTTFDPVLQKAAYDALGLYSGAIVVMQPKTGEILAMVSKPDFNPNNIDDIWEDTINDEESSVLVNRATCGLYPPGSTFKILTALEYIREKTKGVDFYTFDCSGSYKKDDNVIHCFHGTKHGEVDFKKSFAKSCNSSFANIGLRLDSNEFGDNLERLYFNKKIPLDFATLESSVHIGSDSSVHDIMQISIGQGTTQITPLHLSMITSMIANNGNMMIPYMIDRIETADGKVLKRNTPKSLGQLISEDEARLMQELMVAVVEEGTATKLRDQRYKVAGKTGSAEFNKKSDSHAWFTGFSYDTERPLQITVILEGAGSGGEYAVPVAERLFDQYYGNE